MCIFIGWSMNNFLSNNFILNVFFCNLSVVQLSFSLDNVWSRSIVSNKDIYNVALDFMHFL